MAGIKNRQPKSKFIITRVASPFTTRFAHHKGTLLSASTVANTLSIDDAAQPASSSLTLAPSLPISRSTFDASDASTVVINLQGAESPVDHSLLSHVAYFCSRARCTLTGFIRTPPLPSFTDCWRQAMASSAQYEVPRTPRVISPSPTPSETGSRDGYFGPVTRSAARANRRVTSPPPISEDSSGSDPEKRARARSRSPILEGRRRRMSGLTAMNSKSGTTSKAAGKNANLSLANGTTNGHLSPAAANKNYWREMSRSPSPLGLIPIHQKWRSFVRAPSLIPHMNDN